MEDRNDDQIKILSVTMDPRILRRELREMPGVNSVTFDPEKNLLFVAGPVDAMELVNSVAELDRGVRLLPNTTNPRKKTGVHIEEIPTHTHHEGYSSNSPPRRHRGKAQERPPRNHGEEEFDSYQNPLNQGKDRHHKPNRQREKRRGCPRHRGHRKEEEEEEEEEHKREAYVPFSFGDRVCRDFYCTKHPPVRYLEGKVHASDDGYSLLMTSPFLGNFGAGGVPYGGGFPGMYGGARPPRFGYGYQNPRMFQPPFGFQ